MNSLLESTVPICSWSSPDHMCAGGLSDALREKWREDSNIQDISSVDECPRSRSRKLCKTEGSLLRGDKSTSDIDCYISIERGQWKGERVLRWGERRGADCEFSVGIQRHPQVPGLTIINNYTWDTKHFINPFKCVDNIVGVGEVSLDVQLIVRAICLVQWSRSEGNLVASRGKSPSDCLADIWSCSEDEDDGRCAGHDSECRGKSGVW